MKKYVTSATLGITIGTSLAIFFSALFAEGDFTPVNPYSWAGGFYMQHLTAWQTMLVAVLIWAAIGILFQAADVIFSKDWSLLKMSLTHFVVTATGFTILGILAGWMPLNLRNLLFFWGIYVLIYAIIYLINYRQMKASIEAINQSLGKS